MDGVVYWDSLCGNATADDAFWVCNILLNKYFVNCILHDVGTKLTLGDQRISPKFYQFHAVLWKIWQNHMLALPEGWRPLLRGTRGEK